MINYLLINVRLNEGRYHGADDWPPSPARLFQALVAGAGAERPLDEATIKALEWLEHCSAPLIGAPHMRNGQAIVLFVPNNDLDAKGGDQRRISEIRDEKHVMPRLFDAAIPFLYAWPFGVGDLESTYSSWICELAKNIYQFGRGIDMAWADGEVLSEAKLDARFSDYAGKVFRPSLGGNGKCIACPEPGSLASLQARYAANATRFKRAEGGWLFTQAPKPIFVQVAYDSPPSRRLYELRSLSTEATFVVWPLVAASKLAILARDGAVARLQKALPARSEEITRLLVGGKINGAKEVPVSARIKIIPLPSIGHLHSDHGIRRLLIEVPAECSLSPADVHWAFSGLEIADVSQSQTLLLSRATEESMLKHYGVDATEQYCVWRTVTPVALPDSAARSGCQGGSERLDEQARAVAAVVQALRHAQVVARPDTVRVQREPFESHGSRAEAFAADTRFRQQRLWHVEITFNASLVGPLVVGDGRFLGLGALAPVRGSTPSIFAFGIEQGLVAKPDAEGLARALRRAVMARVQNELGKERLPLYFSGHEEDLTPARSHTHLTFVFDPPSERLLVVAPHVIERRKPTREELLHLKTLGMAIENLSELRAGSSGLLRLRRAPALSIADSLLKASRTWESVTPYLVMHHAKHVTAAEVIAADVRAECRRCGLPEPKVVSSRLQGLSGVGLVGYLRLSFDVALEGPIMLGRSKHLGGGLFASIG